MTTRLEKGMFVLLGLIVVGGIVVYNIDPPEGYINELLKVELDRKEIRDNPITYTPITEGVIRIIKKEKI